MFHRSKKWKRCSTFNNNNIIIRCFVLFLQKLGERRKNIANCSQKLKSRHRRNETRRQIRSIGRREKNDVNRRWTSENEGISVSRIEWGGACAEKRVLCRNLPRSWRPKRRGIGEAPGGRYVGQQHASLTVPMGRFAKSSASTIRLRSITGVWQTS